MEVLRRGLHSLESHSELRNLIGEEEDVIKAYENIIKQKDEAVKFMTKWSASQSNEVKDLVHKLQEKHAAHANAYKDLVKEYRNYIASLKQILVHVEKLTDMEKK